MISNIKIIQEDDRGNDKEETTRKSSLFPTLSQRERSKKCNLGLEKCETKSINSGSNYKKSSQEISKYFQSLG